MPERTGYAQGVPSWVDLATSDVEGAKAFYGRLFDWGADEVFNDGEGGRYLMFTKTGKNVAGLAPLPPETEMPPVWSTYIAVDNVDAIVSKATSAGGGVMMPAMDVMDTGRMAFLTDPTGAAFGIWQAGTHKGAQLVNEHGAFTWNELMTDDTEAAKQFYADVFGYRTEVNETPNGPYTTFWADGNVEGNAAAGMMGRPPMMPAEVPNYWGVYFAVDDCDSAVSSAQEIGGTLIMPPMDLPEIGRMAVIQDPQGAVFTVITFSREQK